MKSSIAVTSLILTIFTLNIIFGLFIYSAYNDTKESLTIENKLEVTNQRIDDLTNRMKAVEELADENDEAARYLYEMQGEDREGLLAVIEFLDSIYGFLDESQVN